MAALACASPPDLELAAWQALGALLKAAGWTVGPLCRPSKAAGKQYYDFSATSPGPAGSRVCFRVEIKAACARKVSQNSKQIHKVHTCKQQTTQP